MGRVVGVAADLSVAEVGFASGAWLPVRCLNECVEEDRGERATARARVVGQRMEELWARRERFGARRSSDGV
jgi:hypothetical protein